jgi:hypothetical protein
MALGLFSACGLSKPYPDIRVYDLQMPKGGQNESLKKRHVLLISQMSPDSAFEGRKLVYKLGPNRLAEDFYNELPAVPSRLLAEAAARYLNERSLFLKVEKSPGLEGPDFALEGQIAELYGDYSQDPPRAVLSLRFTLLDARRTKPKALFSQSFSRSLEFAAGAKAEDKPSLLAAAYGRALREILDEILPELERKTHAR